MKICRVCKKEYIGTNKYYCSRKCYYQKHKIIIEKRICKQCNKIFKVPTYSKQKYCCQSCVYKSRRKNKVKRIEKICLECGKPFKILPSEKNRKYCSHQCGGKMHKGKKLSKKTIEKIKQSNRRYWKKNGAINKGKKMSERQKKQIAKTLRNKPGIRKTKLYERIRALPEYKKWRLQVFTRDNFTCQGCKKVGRNLHAHHIKAFSAIIKENKITTTEQATSCSELWNINNGITLCIDCHKETDSYFNNSI